MFNALLVSRIFLRRFLLVLAALLATLPARATDWPQWRGPKQDGISTEKGLLSHLSSNGPPVLWMMERGRFSQSSMVSMAAKWATEPVFFVC